MFLLNKNIPNDVILVCLIIILLSKLPYHNKSIFLYATILLLICVWINIINLILKFNAKIKVSIESLCMLLFTLIIVYSSVYYALYNYNHNSFTGTITSIENTKEKDLHSYSNIFSNLFDMTYFTMSIITSVGYGDITPRSQASRFFVMTQFVIGILLLLLGLIGKIKTK